MAQIQKISPCLWFESQAEEAAGFYTKVLTAMLQMKKFDIEKLKRAYAG